MTQFLNVLPEQDRLNRDLEKRYHQLVLASMDQARALMIAQGQKYDDQSQPIWFRMPFGIFSFVHEIAKKGQRLIQLALTNASDEDFLEELFDTAVYCFLLAGYVRLRSQGQVTSQTGPHTPGPAEPVIVPISSNGHSSINGYVSVGEVSS